jgi:hypothetical protein
MGVAPGIDGLHAGAAIFVRLAARYRDEETALYVSSEVMK